MPLRVAALHPRAGQEIRAAYRWYARRSPSAAQGFQAAVGQADGSGAVHDAGDVQAPGHRPIHLSARGLAGTVRAGREAVGGGVSGVVAEPRTAAPGAGIGGWASGNRVNKGDQSNGLVSPLVQADQRAAFGSPPIPIAGIGVRGLIV